MAAAQDAPLLDLDTLIERPVIAIDGVKFEILHPDELSVIEQARFGRAGRQIDKLAQADEDAGDEVLDALVEKTARKIAPNVPEDAWQKLTGAHHWAIVDLFTALSLRQKMTVAGAMHAATGDLDQLFNHGNRQTGAKSSPGSSDFTAAHQNTGWRKLLPHLFGHTGR